MANSYFKLKRFTVHQQGAAMKVTTDACLFGAWVAQQLQKEKETFLNCLDIGTGTGLLSLMVAQKTTTQIDAVEIEEAAAQQAKENFKASPWPARLQLIKGDIQNLILSHTYDSIFCNPPFYENELASPNAARSVAHHSKSLQLQTLLHIIYQQLKGEGSFFLLLPFKRQKEIQTFLIESRLFAHQTVIVYPSQNHPPFRLMIQGGKREKETQRSTLYIKSTEDAYTPAFTELLKDYYLYL